MGLLSLEDCVERVLLVPSSELEHSQSMTGHSRAVSCLSSQKRCADAFARDKIETSESASRLLLW